MNEIDSKGGSIASAVCRAPSCVCGGGVAHQIDKLRAELIRARAECIKKDSVIAFLSEDLAAPGRPARKDVSGAALEKKIAQFKQHNLAVEESNARLRQQLHCAKNAFEALRTLMSAQVASNTAALHLEKKTVLCVGGRHGDIADYRQWIEQLGGAFIPHVTQTECCQVSLDSRLTVADLVICQTGYINGNTVRQIREFCQRSGKRCVFFNNPAAMATVGDIGHAPSMLTLLASGSSQPMDRIR